MLAHIVLLKWNDKITDEAIAAITENFGKLPAAIPEIKSYEFGPNAGVMKGQADYALVAKFDNAEELMSYIKHQAHQDFMNEYSMPYIESFQSAQFEL